MGEDEQDDDCKVSWTSDDRNYAGAKRWEWVDERITFCEKVYNWENEWFEVLFSGTTWGLSESSCVLKDIVINWNKWDLMW